MGRAGEINPRRLLLIDDDAAVRETLGEVLALEGYAVTCVGTSEEAIAQLDSQPFDAVVTDIRLGEAASGLSICQHARALDPDAVTVVLTAYPSVDSAVEALRSYVSNYLAKPCDIGELKIALSMAIERRDLTRELRRAHEEITAKATVLEQQAELLELAHDAIIVRDLGTSAVRYWSRGAVTTYGFTEAEALGQVTHSLLQTVFPVSQSLVDQALLSTGEWQGELVHITRDGRRITVDSRQIMQRDANGAPVAILELNRDVTERKIAEESRLRLAEERVARSAAEAERERLWQLLMQTPAEVAVFNGPQHVFELANPRFLERFGRAHISELVGKTVREALPDLAGQVYFDLLDRVYTTGKSFVRQGVPARLPRGQSTSVELGYFDLVLQPYRASDGQVVGVISHAYDITDRLRAQRAVEVLAALGRELAGPLEYAHLLDRLARAVVPGFADWVVVDVVEGTEFSQHVALAHVDPGKEELARAVQRGFPPISSPSSPMRQVLESGQSRFDPDLARLSEMLANATDADVPNLVAQLRPTSTISVALAAGGRTLGVMSFLQSDSGRRFTREDVGLAEEIGRRAAAAIENAQLYQRAVDEVEERRAAEERLRFLADAAEVLDSSLHYQVTLDSLARLAVPKLADWCGVDVLEDGQLLSLAVAHVDERKVRLARELQERWPRDLHAEQGVPRVLRTGEPELYRELSDELVATGAVDDDQRRMILEIGPWASGLIVPLKARGRTLGAITLVSGESGRRFGPEDVTLAMEVASHAALSIDNARLYRQLETALGQREAERDRLQQILDQMPEGVIVVDRETRVLAVNDVARALIALVRTGEPLYDSTPVMLAMADGSLLEPSAAPLSQALRDGKATHSAQLQAVNSESGTRVPLMVSAAPLRATSGELIGAVTVFQDITDLKQVEQQKDAFLSAAAHDLRTPLTSIRGLSQLLRRQLRGMDSPSADRISRTLASMDSATKKMSALIDELLDVSQLETTGSLRLDRQRADLVEIARRVIEELRPMSQRHELRLESSADQVLGTFDAGRIERSLTNLVNNAIKYSPGGCEITVRVDEDAQETHGECWATLSVTDQGIGIPADDLERIFDRFHRATNVINVMPGTGIGLSYVQQVVNHHGGTISVASTERVGSTFTIRLPLGERYTQAPWPPST